MALQNGSQLGHYRILALIGRGGMAEVYRAADERLGREVALKVLPPEFAWDPERVERFEREVRAAAQLNHSNIVTVHEFGQGEGQHFYTMALMPGGDLKARIQAHPEGMPAAEARRVGAAVARALDYAHRRGFVHRDVKPENILFDEEGTPQLTDFGIARAMGSGTMTAPGMVIGSPHYMSPEQTRGLKVDGRSDLYSLGVVLYEILTGRLPFDAGDTLAVAYAHVNDPVPELPSGLAGWHPVVDKLLAKSPEDRYGSAGELAAVLSGEAMPRAPATRVMPARREDAPTRQAGESSTRVVGQPNVGSRLPAALGGALLALAVVGIGYVALRDSKAPQPRPTVGGGGGRQVLPAPVQTDAPSTPEIPVEVGRRKPTGPKRVRAAPDEVAAAEAALGLGRETRRMIQQGLAEEGFDPGGADGVFGPGTRAALRGWQRAQGQPVTGYLTRASAAELRAEGAESWAGEFPEPRDPALESSAAWAAPAAGDPAFESRLELEPDPIRYGSLTLELEPAAASVRLPDLEEGYRPGMRLREGVHRVVVRSEGYREAVRTVYVSGDTRVRIALERLRLPKEDVEAVRRYRKAAAQGDAWAQYTLGWMYANGRGVAKDEREAVKWFRKSAEQMEDDYVRFNKTAILELANAPYNLGVSYANGRGVAKDQQEAVKWFRKAAEQGHVPAQMKLAWRYLMGWGVAKDHREAVSWYRNAADQGHDSAQFNLGWMYANGRGVAKDQQEAVKWFRKAAAQGHAKAKKRLAELGAR